MTAYAGSFFRSTAPHVALDRIPLVLLLGAAAVALFGRRLGPRRSASVAFVAMGMALGLLLVHVAHLATLDSARRLLADVDWNLLRIGSLDANLGFVLDPLAATFLFVTLVAAVVVAARARFAPAIFPATPPFFASVLLLAGALSLALLADGFVVLLMGSVLAAVALHRLFVLYDAGAVAGRLLAIRIFADALLLGGFVLLFWGLGGAWRDDGRFMADYRARFVAVRARDHIPPPEEVAAVADAPPGERDVKNILQRSRLRGSITFTSHPGAQVFLGTAGKLGENADPFATSPFVEKTIEAGAHELLIVPGAGAIVAGDGTEVAWIDRLVVDENEHVAIVLVGPTLAFAEIAVQLGLLDETGAHFLRNALYAKRLGDSMRLVALVVLLWALSALIKIASVFVVLESSTKVSPAIAHLSRIVVPAVAIYPLFRLEPLVELAASTRGLLAIMAGVVIVLAAGVRFARRHSSKPDTSAEIRQDKPVRDLVRVLARAASALLSAIDMVIDVPLRLAHRASSSSATTSSRSAS